MHKNVGHTFVKLIVQHTLSRWMSWRTPLYGIVRPQYCVIYLLLTAGDSQNEYHNARVHAPVVRLATPTSP